MADVSFLFVTIDANDAPRVAPFWAELLGTWRTMADPEGTESDIALVDE